MKKLIIIAIIALGATGCSKNESYVVTKDQLHPKNIKHEPAKDNGFDIKGDKGIKSGN